MTSTEKFKPDDLVRQEGSRSESCSRIERGLRLAYDDPDPKN